MAASLLTAACDPPPAEGGTGDPPTPTNVEVTHVGHTSIGLSWEGPPLEISTDEHRIEVHEAGHPDEVRTVATDHDNSGSVHLLSPATTYVLRVIRVEGGEPSAPSEPITVTTRSPAPTGLAVKQVINGPSSSTVYLVWEGQGHEPYRIYWHEAGDPASRESKDVNHGSRYPEPIGVDGTVGGLAHRTSYVFEVVHLDHAGDESEPSNQLDVLTGPYDPPQVEAAVDGNDVTLTWSRPPHHAGRIVYDVQDNGVLETRLRTEADEPHVTISRETPGMTHTYTVGWDGWAEPATQPVSVTIPPSDDTAPPTEPVVTFGPQCGEVTRIMQIAEQSTDDTTPQPQIRYEGLKRSSVFGILGDWYVYDYDLPLQVTNDHERSHPGVPGEDPRSEQIRVRAVDEAGNRSDLVAPQEVFPDCL